MPVTIRLSPRAERALNALARRRRQTRSDVVREAIEHYAAGATSLREERPYDKWADVIGIVRSGGRTADRTTGERFTEFVRRKARARRAR